MSYTVYILRCADGTLYTGVARDADKRLAAHNAGRGAKYTRTRTPCAIVFRERAADKGAALRREAGIKKLARAEKERIVAAFRALAPEPVPAGALTRSDFFDMAEIEKRYYGEEDITPPSEAYRWYRAEPRTTLAARANARVCGFVNLFPLKMDVFSAFAAGCVNDSTVTVSDICVDPDKTPCGMLLSCAAVLPEYRGTGLAMRLIAAAAKAYGPAVRAKRILLDAATPAGESLALRLGFTFALETDHGTRLYTERYSGFLRRLNLLAPEPLSAAIE